MSACGVYAVNQNGDALNRIKIGMSAQKVKEMMVFPNKREVFQIGENNYEILTYKSEYSGKRTPVIFRNDSLLGWGDEVYAKVKNAYADMATHSITQSKIAEETLYSTPPYNMETKDDVKQQRFEEEKAELEPKKSEVVELRKKQKQTSFRPKADGTKVRRTALVIGNSAYLRGPLKNPANDARDMAVALKRVGFDVTILTDATQSQMENAVRDFGTKLRQGGVGLFYYAGHGVQVAGENYLVPVNAVIQSEGDVKYGSVNAGLVLAKMEDAGNGLNIVILDACRSNPYARSFRTANEGLAKMDAPTGSLISYATAPGSVASDGTGRNGVFTRHLLENMEEPGLPISEVLMRVRQGVVKETGKKQVPWEASSLIGQFYFAASAASYATPATQNLKAAAEAEAAAKKQLPLLALPPAPKQSPGAAPASGSPGQTWRDPMTQMEFVWVPEGNFEMGCGSWGGKCYNWEKPLHRVRLNGFWLAKYTVTQGQWQKEMESNPSYFKKGDNYPVEQVSWNDAKEFISKLNAKGSTKFRLPTEAEWEYAARSGGRAEMFAGGDDIDRVAWYRGNSARSTHPVGTKAPNGLGLYDMSGNVWQWCEDVYATYSSGVQDNPVANGDGSSRVYRGGSMHDEPSFVRTVGRSNGTPDSRGVSLGFRLVRSN